jgi:hypothetical protein
MRLPRKQPLHQFEDHPKLSFMDPLVKLDELVPCHQQLKLQILQLAHAKYMWARVALSREPLYVIDSFSFRRRCSQRSSAFAQATRRARIDLWFRCRCITRAEITRTSLARIAFTVKARDPLADRGGEPFYFPAVAFC